MGIELMTSSLPRMRSTPELHRLLYVHRAENEVRTRDPQLGRLMLYQLSYFRSIPRKKRKSRLHLSVGGGGLEPPNPEGADLQSAAIATMRTSHGVFSFRADRGIRTHDPEITNHVLWPTELYRRGAFGPSSLKGIAKVGVFSESTKLFCIIFSEVRQEPQRWTPYPGSNPPAERPAGPGK